MSCSGFWMPRIPTANPVLIYPAVAGREPPSFAGAVEPVQIAAAPAVRAWTGVLFREALWRRRAPTSGSTSEKRRVQSPSPGYTSMMVEPASTRANRINSDCLPWSYIGISFPLGIRRACAARDGEPRLIHLRRRTAGCGRPALRWCGRVPVSQWARHRHRSASSRAVRRSFRTPGDGREMGAARVINLQPAPRSSASLREPARV